MTPEERAEYAEYIKRINVYNGASPETAAILVEQGYWTDDQAADAVAHRRQLDGYLDWEAKRRRPGGGRPKNAINRDALIYCLRDCGKFSYPKIGKLLTKCRLKVPPSPEAYYKARHAGRERLNGRPCTHAEFVELARRAKLARKVATT